MKKTLLATIVAGALAVSLLTLFTACKQRAVTSRRGESKITRIIFVGKKNACDCTRKRIEGSWSALQKALGTPAKLQLERLQIDVDGAKVETYKRQKAIIALPAIYFVDAKSTVLNLLQGSVTDAQITALLKR